MTKDQVQGAGDRALLVLVTWFLTFATNKGWLTTSDVASLAPALVTIVGFAWGYWVNRPKAILQSAAAVVGADGKKTVIVASPELAADTPENNIVSNTPTTVRNAP